MKSTRTRYIFKPEVLLAVEKSWCGGWANCLNDGCQYKWPPVRVGSVCEVILHSIYWSDTHLLMRFLTVRYEKKRSENRIFPPFPFPVNHFDFLRKSSSIFFFPPVFSFFFILPNNKANENPWEKRILPDITLGFQIIDHIDSCVATLGVLYEKITLKNTWSRFFSIFRALSCEKWFFLGGYGGQDMRCMRWGSQLDMRAFQKAL